jgi:putative flippase GtrA
MKITLFIRFVIVGVLNTGFSYFVYATFLFFGLSYALANFLALVIGILFSFKTQGHLVFRNPDNHLLGRFVLGWVVIYLGNILLIGLLVDFGLNAYAAGALTLPFSVGLSWVIQRYIVFRHTTASQSGTGDA